MPVIVVTSFTDPSKKYEIDTGVLTCSCPAYQKSKKKLPCKHLLSIKGLIEVKELPTHPPLSAAMSAMIKAVRLRKPEDAVYWLLYMIEQDVPKYKLLRRMVLMPAEDGVSVPVMEKAVGAYYACLKGEDTLFSMATEIVRVCRTDNWWKDEWGQRYIRGWYESSCSPMSEPVKGFGKLDELSKSENPVKAVRAYMSMVESGIDRKQMLLWLKDKAGGWDRQASRRLASLALSSIKMIGSDDNHIGQALWSLYEDRPIRPEDTPKVTRGDVIQLIESQVERWKSPESIPSYYLDGVHTIGSDRRFAGILVQMSRCIKAYEKWGRLDPADKWNSEIYGK